MKNQNTLAFLSMAIAATFMTGFDLEKRALAEEQQPDYTFAETLEEQEAQLKKNPPMPRLDESREKMAGGPAPPRKILDITSEADVRDIDLLAGLDPDYPPVARVVKLYRAGKIGDAKRALCDHFRNRTIGWPYFTRDDVKRFPRHAYFPGNVYPGGPTLLGRATMMLDNRLHDNWNAGTPPARPTAVPEPTWGVPLALVVAVRCRRRPGGGRRPACAGVASQSAVIVRGDMRQDRQDYGPVGLTVTILMPLTVPSNGRSVSSRFQCMSAAFDSTT